MVSHDPHVDVLPHRRLLQQFDCVKASNVQASVESEQTLCAETAAGAVIIETIGSANADAKPIFLIKSRRIPG
ncbi:MAG: hypothetical protein ACK5NT_13125 [Pyrinomonadaceae bacterium]